MACNNEYHRARTTSLKAIFIKREEGISREKEAFDALMKGLLLLVNSMGNQKSFFERRPRERRKRKNA